MLRFLKRFFVVFIFFVGAQSAQAKGLSAGYGHSMSDYQYSMTPAEEEAAEKAAILRLCLFIGGVVFFFFFGELIYVYVRIYTYRALRALKLY